MECRDDTEIVPLTFSWSSTGAELAWFGTGTENAKAQPDDQVDPNASYGDAVFDCSKEDELYTVTLDDGSGKLTSTSVTFIREFIEG